MVEWTTGMEYWNAPPTTAPFEELCNQTSTVRRTDISSYIGGTLVLLRTTIGIICWTEMVTISIVWIILSVYMYIILCVWHTALRSYTKVDGVSL